MKKKNFIKKIGCVLMVAGMVAGLVGCKDIESKTQASAESETASDGTTVTKVKVEPVMVQLRFATLMKMVTQ